MTIKDIRIKYAKKLDYLDLELVIAHAIGKSREFVLAHLEYELFESEKLKVKSYLKRRMKNEPLAYILGHKEFYGLDFIVNKNVLIPRPETELLVDLALKKILNTKYKILNTKIIDVGTGSGNVIIAIAKQLQNHESRIMNYDFFGIDISEKALKVAKQNAKLHKVYNKIKFLQDNLLEPLVKIGNSTIIIVANLPYLDKNWKNLLQSSDSIGIKYEPKLALEGGSDGLDLYRKLAQQAKKLKKNNGQLPITIFCEIGHLQSQGIRKIFSFASEIKIYKDLAQRWRVCEIKI